jgi:hypothetical protein
MFRSLDKLLPKPGDVFTVHPLQLSRWLDEVWTQVGTVPAFGPGADVPPFLGSTEIIETLNLPAPFPAGTPAPVPSGLARTSPDSFNGQVFDFTQTATDPSPPSLIWDHLAYAYLIESTGVFEVMAEVLRRLTVGETLGPLSAAGTRWVRATEELFFREPPLFAITGVVSEVRPGLRVARRNHYWRMFGMEPPHPLPARWVPPGAADQSWKADLGGGANTGFREKWSELLRQVWLGFENARNGIGPNATDREYVAFLAKALRDMMMMRRRGGALAREEFVDVSTMSWFHLTLESDTPIIRDLKAEATSPADRLARIAQLVGMAPAPRSRELFELADLMSALLRAIELGLYDTGAGAETLYLPFSSGGGGADNAKVIEDMNRIIDLWQSATGERVKDRPAGALPGQGVSAQPLRLPSTASTNLPPTNLPPTTLAPTTPAATALAPAGTAARNGRR